MERLNRGSMFFRPRTAARSSSPTASDPEPNSESAQRGPLETEQPTGQGTTAPFVPCGGPAAHRRRCGHQLCAAWRVIGERDLTDGLSANRPGPPAPVAQIFCTALPAQIADLQGRYSQAVFTRLAPCEDVDYESMTSITWCP